MSGNGLATRAQAAPITVLATAPVTAEQLELIKKTVAKEATTDELKLYLYDCARQGVHPLDRLIHFTKRGGRYTPVTSIDFMRIQAANTGDCLGISDPEFHPKPTGSDPERVHPPSAATVTVKRYVQGQVAEFTATARWAEYFPGEQSGHMWKKMPHTMLGKCAEALALRKGFPKQLAGLYAREEMDQAQDAPPVVTRQPEPVNVQTGEVIEPPQRTTLPEGAVYIDSCTPLNGKAKKAGTVKLSTGEEATVWQSTGQLFDLAVALCQEGKPVRVELQPGKGNYGPTLKGLSRLDGEHDQRRADAGDWTNDVPPVPVSDSDIPF